MYSMYCFPIVRSLFRNYCHNATCYIKSVFNKLKQNKEVHIFIHICPLNLKN